VGDCPRALRLARRVLTTLVTLVFIGASHCTSPPTIPPRRACPPTPAPQPLPALALGAGLH